MTPTLDPRNIFELQSMSPCMRLRRLLGGQNNASCAIGNLATVKLSNTPLNHRIKVISLTETTLSKLPASGLSVLITLRVTKVDLCDFRQRFIRNTVALLILPGDTVKHERPGKITAKRFMAGPSRRSQVFCTGLTIDIAHKLQAQNTGNIIVARLNVSHRTEHGYGPRGTSCLMTGCGQHC